MEWNIAKSSRSGRLACIMYRVRGARRFMGNGYQYLNFTACKKLSGDPKLFLGADIGQWAGKHREQIFFKGWIGSFEMILKDRL